MNVFGLRSLSLDPFYFDPIQLFLGTDFSFDTLF